MIEVKNLVKKYGDHAAVNELSFTVEAGKVVGFLGPNGAGKSTTMNMITGYIAPTDGEIFIDGVEINDNPSLAKKKIGYLPEIPPVYTDLRVREYLNFVVELKKVPRKDRDGEVLRVMKKTGTYDVSERLIGNLSKGYRQRVGLAAAMLGNPDILILDEPTVGLDPKQIIEIRDLIRELSKRHTILLSSHIMQEITAVCDEIIIINEGQMIAKDTPENLTKQMVEKNGIHLIVKGERNQIKEALRTVSGIKNVRYDEKNEEGLFGFTLYAMAGQDIREDVFFAMSGISCPIYEMHPLAASLEDAFLALTKNGSRQFAGKKKKKKNADTGNQEQQTENEEKDTLEAKEKEEK